MLILVGYDLKKTDRNYDALYDQLKLAKYWWHYLDSTWLLKIDSDDDAVYQEWVDKLNKLIDSNDYILTMKIDIKLYNGWLPQAAWDWIRTNRK